MRLMDRVAYINHDIDDAVRAGVITTGDLPPGPIEILGETGPRRIDTLVHDLVEHSEPAGDIVQGELIGAAMTELREFMFERVYLGPEATREHAKIERVVRHCSITTALIPTRSPIRSRPARSSVASPTTWPG